MILKIDAVCRLVYFWIRFEKTEMGNTQTKPDV